MSDLAIILVTWNVHDLAVQALRSLFADIDAHGPEAEVYVVDCASSDGTAAAIAAAFPAVRLIASAENLGFARANNLALRTIGFGSRDPVNLPKAVYLLNPDTITHPRATRHLYDTLLADARNGLVGAQLAYEDGTLQHAAFSFPGLRQLWVEFFPTPGRWIEGSFNGRYARALYEAGKPFEVDCVLGATMMLRREVIEQTGMFDEQFFMYCEEIDWAWRIRKDGWRILCAPAARVTHLAGRSTGQVRARSIINLWTSRLILFRKHFSAWKFWIARQLIRQGMARKLRDSSLPQEVADAYQAIRDKARSP
jgi:hypothetical protein